MRKSKINQELFDLLTSGRFEYFTVAELKVAYKALPNCPYRTEKAGWQFIYRQVEKMKKDGLISRFTGPADEKTRYRWNVSTEANLPQARTPMAPTQQGVADDDMRNCLKEKLHRYKIEMLSAIGETEEYDAICTELPQMRSAVQDLYNDARDRCSKILGRVRALESILSNQSQYQQPA